MRRALLGELACLGGKRLLLACSGGPDSVALVHVLAGLSAEFDLSLLVVGVDHGLRSEAAAELELAAALARSLDLEFVLRRVRLASTSNLHAQAREARFSTLRELKDERSADFIATAHHADDRAETVLIRLLRGAAPGSFGVLPARDGDLVRPLLRVTRVDIEQHLSRHHLQFASDPSNQDPRFLRARVRHELVPKLRELSPRIVQHLNTLADAMLDNPSGAPPELKLRQREAVAEAKRRGAKNLRVRRSEREEVLVDLDAADPRLTDVLSPRARKAPRPSTATPKKTNTKR